MSHVNNTDLGRGLRHELLVKLEHRELGRIEDLIAELPIALDTQDLQVDITS